MAKKVLLTDRKITELRKRMAKHTVRDGKAVVLDIDVAIDGAPLSQATWYQRYSIADVRKKRLNG